MQPNNTRLLHTAQYATLLIPLANCFSIFVADALMAIVAILFLVESARSKNWGWTKSPWVRVALLLWVYLMVDSLFAEHIDKALRRSTVWIRYPVFTAGLVYWLWNAEFGKKLLLSVAVSVIFLVGDSLLQYAIGYDIIGRPSIGEDGKTLRLTGPYKDPRVGITLVWLAFPVVLYGLSLLRKTDIATWQKLGAVLLALAFVLAVFLSGERMALLLTGLGIGLAVLCIRSIRMPLIAAGVVAALIGFGIAQLNPQLIERQYASTLHVIQNLEDTVYGKIWQSAWDVGSDYPITGVGLRHFREHCPDAKYGPIEELAPRCNLHPHNIYLEWWVESGIIGLAMFLLMAALWARNAAKAWPACKHDAIYIGLLITLALRLWPIASTTSFFIAWSAVPFWLTIGWLLAYSQTHRTQGENT